jgi:hypothetical protein
MGTYIAIANFRRDAQRVATKGETLELIDAEALELLRNGRIEPADEATRKRFRQESRTTWGSPPEPTAAQPGSWLNWR